MQVYVIQDLGQIVLANIRPRKWDNKSYLYTVSLFAVQSCKHRHIHIRMHAPYHMHASTCTHALHHAHHSYARTMMYVLNLSVLSVHVTHHRSGTRYTVCPALRFTSSCYKVFPTSVLPPNDMKYTVAITQK